MIHRERERPLWPSPAPAPPEINKPITEANNGRARRGGRERGEGAGCGEVWKRQEPERGVEERPPRGAESAGSRGVWVLPWIPRGLDAALDPGRSGCCPGRR